MSSLEKMMLSWQFPASVHEQRIVAELQKADVRLVERADPAVLQWMRMPPMECHANALFIQRNDPEKKMRRVSGWIVEDGLFVLHSVVRKDRNLICVTPAPLSNGETHFTFIPDARIKWREVDGFMTAYRGGYKIGPGVRVDPAKTLRDVALVLERLADGLSKYDAVRLP